MFFFEKKKQKEPFSKLEELFPNLSNLEVKRKLDQFSNIERNS